MQQVAERRHGEWNKIEAGGMVSQWVPRVSVVSEKEGKEDTSERVAEGKGE